MVGKITDLIHAIHNIYTSDDIDFKLEADFRRETDNVATTYTGIVYKKYYNGTTEAIVTVTHKYDNDTNDNLRNTKLVNEMYRKLLTLIIQGYENNCKRSKVSKGDNLNA